MGYLNSFILLAFNALPVFYPGRRAVGTVLQIRQLKNWSV